MSMLQATAQAPSPHILLVEDNEADIELTRLAFEEEGFYCRLDVTHNGAEAMDYLRQREPFSQASTPHLILLDLNMPRMDGKQLLDAIKYDRTLKEIPVMLLTSSRAQHDIHDCYHLNASCYMIKPTSAAERATMVRRISGFLGKTSLTPFLSQHP